ncbi:hypothetical protein F183_A17870 [Bryobacterales bacterium F-183]|nr:hypothetical protein F183_A17870 [Bryobacterales bacterium F-183]
MPTTASTDSLQLSAPTVITQSGMTCWAAAVLSWLKVKNAGALARYANSEKGIVDAIREWSALNVALGQPALIHDNGGLTGEGSTWVMDNVGSKGIGFKQASIVTGTFILSKLKEKGHLYMIRIWVGGMSHAVVVYGIENANNAKICQISVMDPRPNYGLKQLSLSELRTDHQVWIAWMP